MTNNLAELAGAGDTQETSAYHAFKQSDQGVTDLGTLGGNQSSALGSNTPGQAVGFSTVADGTVHAFLFSSDQMVDLNSLCDLAAGGFRLLTVAKAINDSMVIVGEGIANDGQKHAFMLTPLAIDGGNWRYISGCDPCQPGSPEGQWVWIQIDGWWWWETHCGCYRWHGPPGRNPPCPPQPPHCWWWPLPCPPHCDCERPPGDNHPTPTPTRTPTSPTPPTQRTPFQTPTPPKRRTPIPQTPTPPRQTPTRSPRIPPITHVEQTPYQPTPPPTPGKKRSPSRPRPEVVPTPPKLFIPGIKVIPTPQPTRSKPTFDTPTFNPNIQAQPTKPPVRLLDPPVQKPSNIKRLLKPTPTPADSPPEIP